LEERVGERRPFVSPIEVTVLGLHSYFTLHT